MSDLSKRIFVSKDVTEQSMMEHLGFEHEIISTCLTSRESFEDEYDEPCKEMEVCITIKEIK